MRESLKPDVLRVPLESGELFLPSLWRTEAEGWFRELGRTTILVVDDQIQSLADLSDEYELKRRLLDPFNVEFVFCPECAPTSVTARNGQWFSAVEERLRAMSDRVAAVFLDVMFDGEWDPRQGSGVVFLRRIQEVAPRMPVLIMTQAKGDPSLREALARSGLHLSFLRKDDPDRLGAFARFLFEYGWVADPSYAAYSRAMREAVAEIRRYAVVRPRLDSGLPQPILFVAGSGEGKTRTALTAAKWYSTLKPPVRSSSVVEILDCNALERGQGAQIALFGRGPRDRAERTDASGLAVTGKAQRSDEGILIIDELGNSTHAFQEMLLAFVETGRTQPEWVHDEMTPEALGPLDVMCEFTAQPRHIEEGRIKEDIARRYARGTTVFLPALRERGVDAVAIFLSSLEEGLAATGRSWVDRTSPDELLLPEARKWIEDSVSQTPLSASALVDLLGSPAVFPIGIPYLEHRLPRVERVTGRRAKIEDGRESGVSSAPDRRTENGLGTVERATASRLEADGLRGRLDDVLATAARGVLEYVEACARVAQGARAEANVLGTYKLMAGLDAQRTDTPAAQDGAGSNGGRGVGTTEARTRIKNVFLVSPEQSASAIRESDVIARLAIEVARGSRSRALSGILRQVATDSLQRDRLSAMGWKG